MARWDITPNDETVNHQGGGVFVFYENTSDEERKYTIKYTDDDGCTAETEYTIPEGTECRPTPPVVECNCDSGMTIPDGLRLNWSADDYGSNNKKTFTISWENCLICDASGITSSSPSLFNVSVRQPMILGEATIDVYPTSKNQTCELRPANIIIKYRKAGSGEECTNKLIPLEQLGTEAKPIYIYPAVSYNKPDLCMSFIAEDSNGNRMAIDLEGTVSCSVSVGLISKTTEFSTVTCNQGNPPQQIIGIQNGNLTSTEQITIGPAENQCTYEIVRAQVNRGSFTGTLHNECYSADKINYVNDTVKFGDDVLIC